MSGRVRVWYAEPDLDGIMSEPLPQAAGRHRELIDEAQAHAALAGRYARISMGLAACASLLSAVSIALRFT